MAVVQGVKEKVHLPIYDSLAVEPEKQLREAESSSTLKFFVNVQNKTKLETNLQSAGLLPHYNTFEARALRVVFSDLPATFPGDPTASDSDLPVTGTDPADSKDKPLQISAASSPGVVSFAPGTAITADIELGLDQLMELLKKAQEDPDKSADLPLDDDAVTLKAGTYELNATQVGQAVDIGDPLSLTVADLEGYISDLDEKKQPAAEQIHPNNGAGTLISKLLYNTVTTLYVGEKIMISMPTWFFPAGAGPYSEGAKFATNGEPNPMATFRFAEPIFIDKQQNFRVEMEIPDRDDLTEIQKIYGPLFIWVVIDGYMTRDVQ